MKTINPAKATPRPMAGKGRGSSYAGNGNCQAVWSAGRTSDNTIVESINPLRIGGFRHGAAI
jgi:hypothetical protein